MFCEFCFKWHRRNKPFKTTDKQQIYHTFGTTQFASVTPGSSLRRFNSSLKAFFCRYTAYYFKSKQQCRLWGINVLFKLYQLNSLRLSTTRWMKRIILLKVDMRIFKVQLTFFCFDMAFQNLPDGKHCEL